MRGIGSIIFLVFALSGTQALAKAYSFSTPANSTDSAAEPVSAKATFSVSAGSMVVTLINLQSGTVSVGQDISSLFFTVNNGGTILSLASADLVGSSGTEVTVLAGGAVSGVHAVNPVTHWAAGSSAGQSYLNDLISGGNPIHTIIGPASTGGNYATVNTTIAGNATNNPFIQNQATFTFSNPGLLASSTVSNVSIGFGTVAASAVRAVPEPGSLFLVSIGMLAALRRSLGR